MKLVSYGLDYLTLTNPDIISPSSEPFRRVKAALIEHWYNGQSGIEQKTWGWNGYAGVSWGPLSWGTRHDSTIMRVSGGAAQYLPQFGLWGPWRASRVDVQVTFVPEGLLPDAHIQAEVGRAQSHKRSLPGRTTSIRHIRSFGDGDTLYVGSRSSDRFIRVYNKSIESANEPEYNGCVRVECEFKGALANAAYGRVVDALDCNMVAYGILAAEANRAGLTVPTQASAGLAEPIRVAARATDMEEKLNWLERSVSGNARRLVAEGYGQDVLVALGLKIEQGLLTVRGEGDIL